MLDAVSLGIPLCHGASFALALLTEVYDLGHMV